MKKIILTTIAVLFLFCSFGQKHIINRGYFITKHTNKDVVDSAAYVFQYETLNDFYQGDTIFFINSAAGIDSINNILIPATTGVLIALQRGVNHTGILTLNNDSVTFCSYGTGAVPKYNGVDMVHGESYLAESEEPGDETYLTSATYVVSTNAELAAISPMSGDTVGLQAGAVLDTTLYPVAGVHYETYGTGNKATLKGSTSLNEWTLDNENIYKTTLDTMTNQVFLNGDKLTLSSSTTYDTITNYQIDSNVDATSFIDAALIGTDWTEAYCHFRTSNWNLRSRKVIACNPSTGQVTIKAGVLPITLSTGMGYFITNHISLLDEAGEWCYDGTDSTLYVWTPNGDSPANYTMEASTINDGISATSVDDVIIKNLTVKNYNRKGINFYNSSGFMDNILIDSCELIDNYYVGINLGCYETHGTGFPYNGAKNSDITNCTVSGTLGIGISTWSGDSTAGDILSNTVVNIGLYEGIGLDGIGEGVAGAAEAMHLWSRNGTVAYNTIDSVSYNGITFKGLGMLIEYNVISNCVLQLTDGAGIYTYGIRTGSVVRNNIVFDMFGAPNTNANYGIYFDDGTEDVTMRNNTVYNCLSGFGIFLHDNNNDSVYENTVYNTVNALYANDLGNLDNMYIANNTLFGLTTSQETGHYGLTTWDDTKFILEGNGYYNPQNLANVHNNLDGFSKEAWGTYSGEENVLGFDSLINNYSDVELITSNLKQNPRFDNDVSYWSLAGVSAVWNDTHLDTGCMAVPIHSLGYTNMNSSNMFDTTSTDAIIKISYDVITDGGYMQGTLTVKGVSAGGFVADSVRRHYEHFVTLSAYNYFGLSFQIFGAVDSLVYFDNFEVYRVNATEIASTEKSKLFVNAADTTMTIPNSTNYTALDGGVLPTTVDEWESIIGILKDE